MILYWEIRIRFLICSIIILLSFFSQSDGEVVQEWGHLRPLNWDCSIPVFTTKPITRLNFGITCWGPFLQRGIRQNFGAPGFSPDLCGFPLIFGLFT